MREMAKRKRKNQAAVALGRRGGKATAAKRTQAERSESAHRAAHARWGPRKDKP